MQNIQKIKSVLLLVLVSFTLLLGSCSKDDALPNANDALGNFKVTVDGKSLNLTHTQINVTKGIVNQDTGKREDGLLVSGFNQEKAIQLQIGKLTGKGTYEVNIVNFISLADVKNTSNLTTYTTGNNLSGSDKGSFKVLEYDEANKKIKVEITSVIKNTAGDAKTMKVQFFKEFTFYE